MTTTDFAKQSVRWGLGHALPGTLMRVGARRGDLQARVTTETRGRTAEQISPLLDEVRACGVMVPSRLGYITVDHQAVRDVLSSNDVRAGFEMGEESRITRMLHWAKREGIHPVEAPSLLAVEPPNHTRYRKLVTRVFTARAVERLRERTEKTAARLLDAMPTGTPIDLVDAYCSRLPVQVIADILGVPEEDHARVLDIGGRIAASLDMGVGWREFRDIEASLDEFDEYLRNHLDRLRRHPGEDLFSQLVQVSDDGDRLTERELVATAGLVLAAGFETTVNLLGNAFSLLHANPDQLAVLRAEPELWSNTVDEVLRLDPPVLLTGRQVLRDSAIGGAQLRQGQIIVTVLAGANRDPAVFDDPHRFDVRRSNARDHIAFSGGRHFCLGAALARMEGEVALRAFYERFGSVDLLPGAYRRPTRILRGWETLPAVVA